MIQVERIFLFETEVLEPFFFGTIDGITAKMKDQRTIELLDIALCEYELTGVVKGGLDWSASFGGEDNGILRTLGKQEYEYSLSFNVPLYSGRIIDEMVGRQFSCLCQRRNGTRFVIFAQFEAEKFGIDNEAVSRITLSTGRTSAELFNVNSFNITTIRDTIDIAAVCANLDNSNRMSYGFFPTTNIPIGYAIESTSFSTAIVIWGKSLGASSYTIVWGTDGLTFPNTVPVSGGGTETFEITGLPVGATFYTKIKAVGQFVDSLFSAVVNDVTLNIEAPQNYVLSNFGETTISADWDTTTEATGYEIVWGTDGILFPNSQEVISGAADSATITGLPAGTEIFSKILAHTPSGDSSFSNVDAGDTLAVTFRFTIQSDNTGASNNDEFEFPQRSETSPNYVISCLTAGEEGNTVVVADISDPTLFTFNGGAGTYLMEIEGVDIQPFFNQVGDALKLIDVLNWGDCIIGTRAFFGCEVCTFATATDTPPALSSDQQHTFRNTILMVGNSSWNSWDVSGVTNFGNMFNNADAFNILLDQWVTSSATGLSNMFSNTISYNQPLPWDTSSVTNMNFMFSSAMAFNQNLSSFDFTALNSAGALNSFIKNVPISSENYNGLLAGLVASSVGLGIFSGMTLGADGAVATGQGVIDRTFLQVNDAMTFVDSTPP